MVHLSCQRAITPPFFVRPPEDLRINSVKIIYIIGNHPFSKVHKTTHSFIYEQLALKQKIRNSPINN